MEHIGRVDLLDGGGGELHALVGIINLDEALAAGERHLADLHWREPVDLQESDDAISGADIAGKALGLPVYQLLGGKVRDRVRVYCESGAREMTPGDEQSKARIKEIKPLGIYLTVIENDLGVLRAFCSQCRREMLFTARGFYCKACESGEDRKTPAPGAQPALFAEPSPSSPRDMRGRDFGRDSRGGERDRRSFGGGRERGGDRRGGRDRGPPRRDFGRSERSERGGRRDSRGAGGPLGRRKNIGSYYPAN